MKISVIILILVLSIQLFIPCDDELHAKDTQTVESVYTDSSDLHDDHHDTDSCAPLCTCHCCHSHVLTSIKDNITENFLVTFTKNTLSLDILNNYIKITPKPPQA